MTASAVEVVIAEDAIERLSADLDSPALVVADANTFEAAGAAVMSQLGDAELFVFPQRTGLLADLDAVEAVRARLRGGRLPVAVGAGVITDIVRYAAHQLDSGFLSVPTAASMDGYASSLAALQLDGVKVTFSARSPRGIYADPRVAAAAPVELTRSGLGDLLAKASARVDWLAAHLLYGEPYLSDAAELVLEPLSFAATNASAVLAGAADAVRGLLTGLIRSGLAMAMAGSSRPASGCEHHASHFWDLLAARGLRPHHPHGLQVGYATRFTARLQRFAFGGQLGSVGLPALPADPLGPAAREWLGNPPPEVVTAVAEKQRFASALGAWPRDAECWVAVQSQLAPELERLADVEQALGLAGIPRLPGYLDVDATTLRATFRYAGRLRARYTTLDFLEGQGRLEEAIEHALAATTATPRDP